jgi:hypothetical protein
MIEFLRRYEVCLGQQYPRLNRALVGHHKVSVKPRQVKIVATSLHYQGDIDIRRNHLEVYGFAGVLTAQERLPLDNAMNNGGAARCVALHTNPVAHTRQVDSGLDCETELTREFRICLGVLMSDEECTPIDGRDARNAVPGL